MRLRVRFVEPPGADARRALRETMQLIADGARLRFRDRVATIEWPDDAPVDVGALHAQAPIAEVDRGDGFLPYDAIDDVGDDDLPTAPAPDETPPAPLPVDEALRAQFVFDDYLLAAPHGRTLAFVRDESRCHFATLHILDGRGRPPLALPVIAGFPRVAWAADGDRAVVSGPEHLLALDAAAGTIRVLGRYPGEDGFDIAWLDERRAAVVGHRWLRLLSVDDNRVLTEIPCDGGRLVRALDRGTLLVVGTAEGTALVEVSADDTLTLVRRTWRSLVDAWERDGRAFAHLASGEVVELVGLASLRARARPGAFRL
jgi:hypothetical protein